MSTIIDQPQNLPILESLQQVANELFKGLPNEFPKEISLNPQEHPRANHFAETLYAGLNPIGLEAGSTFGKQPKGFNLANPPSSLPDPHFAEGNTVPAPFPGIGFTPSLPAFENPLSVSSLLAASPNPHNTDSLRTPPSFSGAGISPSLTHFQNPAALEQPYKDNLPYGNLVGANAIPNSVAGSGISPSTGGNGISPLTSKSSEFKRTQGLVVLPFGEDLGGAALPDPQYAGKDIAPQSVAGVGKSPSAIHHGNEVNLGDPQTSLLDPHFAGDGKIPASVAGSGKSPSIIDQQGEQEKLRFSGAAFDKELLDALSSIVNFESSTQLPGYITAYNEPSYYFLEGNKPLPSVNEKATFQKSSFTQQAGNATPPFDINLIRKDFPILQETVNGKPLVWLDNAATTQKPRQVIDRVSYFYEHENSNIHRAAHELAARATDAYEGAREKIRKFINAASVNEVVFVRGTTEAINLVAKSWGEQYLDAGDEIILSQLEHHANIVPWQQLAAKKGLVIKVIPVDDAGQVLLAEYAKLLTPKTKLVSFTQVSNALGTVTPAKAIIEMAHATGAKVLLDGAQSVSHLRTDVLALNCDWFVFSGHKIFGPTGIGVLYGKEAILNATEPWQGGGNMIMDVTFEHTKYHNAPSRFEAGTGNIADAVGLGAALDYVSSIGIELINQYEHALLEYATGLMKQVKGLRLIGTAPNKASVLSFVLEGYSNNEVGQALNKEGIAVRTGHHCAQPILRRFGLESTVRPSLAFYNNCDDVDRLVAVLHQLKKNN